MLPHDRNRRLYPTITTGFISWVSPCQDRIISQHNAEEKVMYYRFPQLCRVLDANNLRVCTQTWVVGDNPLPRYIGGEGGLQQILLRGLDVPIADI